MCASNRIIMEVVGVVASVVTLTQLVIEGVRLAKTLYAAPDDLAALQEQLENFSSLVQEIDRSHGEGTDGIVTQSLVRAKLSIEQLHQLIQIKLLKNLNGGTSRARRRAWARNKSKILALRDVLKECRDNLSVALGAKNSAFSAQTETSLAVIVQETGQSRQSLTTVDTRLSEIQQSLVAAQKAIDAQSHSLSHILTSVSSRASTGQLQKVGSQAPWPSRSEFLESTLNAKPSCISRPSPAGIFELSGNFFPELYTMHEGPSSVPMLIYSAFEEHSTAVSRTNHYQFFFLRSQRQWRRLSLSLTVSKSSRYWDYTQLSTSKVPFASTSYNLPQCFREQVEHLMWNIEDIRHDTHISLTVSEDTDARNTLKWSAFDLHSPTAEAECAGKKVINMLQHLGCSLFYEHEVIQIATISMPSAFLVCVQKRLLYEFQIPTIPEDFSHYTIQLLQCLRGSRGLAKLAGVVIDCYGRQMKSYLREIPAKNWMFSIIADAIDRGSKVSWSRRERWAQEITAATSLIHSKGFVVGVLGDFASTPIIIDKDDHALLWSFRNKTWADSDKPGYLPPELRHTADVDTPTTHIGTLDQSIEITPPYDIFQLGILLWLIASDQSPRRMRHFCHYESCQSSRICLTHANMIELPPLPESVPQYYKALVALCRSQDPMTRPPARTLLELFPAKTDSTADSELGPEALSLKSLVTDFNPGNVFCDLCGDEILSNCFHCNTCVGGDFDMCEMCLNKGLHCNDATHLLVELTLKQGVLVPINNYYGSANRDGERDVIHI